jgi:hypothetical protein
VTAHALSLPQVVVFRVLQRTRAQGNAHPSYDVVQPLRRVRAGS